MANSIMSSIELFIKHLPVVSSLIDWMEFSQLKRIRRDTRIAYAKQFEEYREDKTKTGEDMQRLASEEYYELKSLDEAVDKARSNRLIEECTKYDIEIPQGRERPEFWQQAEQENYHYLSAKGRVYLRNLIREEKARSAQDWTRWLPFIGAITGLIGVIIGLLSVFKR